jgi:1-acyl-sn-glycerol-3-phosphate acyltransferase
MQMRYVRAIGRSVALFLVTLGFFLVYLLILPILLPGHKRRWRRWNTQTWARTLLRIIGVKVEAHNNRPVGPFLLVSNHLSYLDIIVLQSQLDCAFVAKSEVATWPVFGLICRSVGTIFINRQVGRHIHQTLTQIRTTLEEGLGVVLFAEGTSTNGQSISRFKSSLLEAAARERMAVHYASITYAVPFGEQPPAQSVCWWGDMTFSDHVFRLLQIRTLESKIVYGVEPITADSRRALATKLWSAVNAQFQPVGYSVSNGVDLSTEKQGAVESM